MLSYRRDDAAPYAGRLYDRLSAAFGRESVFMDIDTIRPGDDFVTVIENTLRQADAVLVVIGPRWTAAVDQAGKRRLHQSGDYVRLEVVTALESNMRVIPVLVGGAGMPDEDDLPAPLLPLIRRNAVEISDQRFHVDVDRLIEALKPVVSGADVVTPDEDERETRNDSKDTDQLAEVEPTNPPPASTPEPRPHSLDPIAPELAPVARSAWIEANLLWSAGVLTIGLYHYLATRAFTRMYEAARGHEQGFLSRHALWPGFFAQLFGFVVALMTVAMIPLGIWATAPDTLLTAHLSATIALACGAAWILVWFWIWTSRAESAGAENVSTASDEVSWQSRCLQRILAYLMMFGVNVFVLAQLGLAHLALLDDLTRPDAAILTVANGIFMLLMPVCLYNAGHTLFKDMVWHLLGRDVTSLDREARRARKASHLWGLPWFWPWLYADAVVTLGALYLVYGDAVVDVLQWR